MTPDARAFLYELLALSFTYPDDYFVDRLKGLIGELEVEAWDEDSHGLPVLPIAPYIRALATFNEQTIERVQQEYVRLFIESHPDALCSVHEWVYCLDTPREALAHTLQITYASWGQDVSLFVATHVETELEFLALLCRYTNDEASRRARQNFLREHALRWLPRFAEDVANCTQLDFYRAAAQLLAAFLEIEANSEITSGDVHRGLSCGRLGGYCL